MLDSEFDPYQALINMDKNIQALVTAHNALADRVREHEETIDVLIKGLNAANVANIKLMEENLKNIYANINSQGQH